MTAPSATSQTGSEPTPPDASVSGNVGDPILAPMWDLVKRLPSYARVTAAMAKDDRVPASAKGMLVVAGAYLVSPIDLIPGIIPVAGQIDDLYVVLTGLQQAVKFCPPGVADEHFAAVGLSPDSVDRDLATIRQFVRRGLTWSMQQGGRLVARSSRQVASLVRRLGQRGDFHHDQTTRQQESTTERS